MMLPFEEQQAWTSSSSSFIFPFPFYRIHLKGYSGTAGKISSIGQSGSDFSTKDADNDKCVCKCSQLTTGGKSFFFSINYFCFLNICTGWEFRMLTSVWCWVLTHPNLGITPQNLQGHLKHSFTSVARSESTISPELITDQLSGEFRLYNSWH